MRNPVDRALVGLYVTLIGVLGGFAGLLLHSYLVLWVGLGIALFGAALCLWAVWDSLRRQGDHRRRSR